MGRRCACAPQPLQYRRVLYVGAHPDDENTPLLAPFQSRMVRTV
jgi:LmbE family N-acetylglucosaminyl deacetylase